MNGLIERYVVRTTQRVQQGAVEQRGTVACDQRVEPLRAGDVDLVSIVLRKMLER